MIRQCMRIDQFASVKGGKRLPKGHELLDDLSPHPYLRIVDFTEDGIDPHNIKYISPETHQHVSRYTISSKDVYVSIAGTIGRVGIVPEYLDGANLTENAAKITNINEFVDPRYLSYFLRSYIGQQILKLKAGGTSQPKLALYRIGEIEVPMMDLAEQLSVVGVLTAYDDLIENNRRRIKLLEESAQQLYKEWFVRFRFPGYEQVSLVEGVPEGWELKRLINLAEITMGQSPKSEFYNEDGNGRPFHQGVTDFGFRYVTHRRYCTKPTRLSQSGDILFSVRAPVGRINLTDDQIILGRGLSAMHSRTGHQSFLFYQLKSLFFKEDLVGSGAIYAAINKPQLETQELLCPPIPLVDRFEEIASLIDQQIKVLIKSIDQLAKARDILLPKLMNGEIEV